MGSSKTLRSVLRVLEVTDPGKKEYAQKEKTPPLLVGMPLARRNQGW